MKTWELWQQPEWPRDEEERRRLHWWHARAFVVLAAVMGLYMVVAHIWLALAVAVVGLAGVAVIVGFVIVCCQAARGGLDR